MRSYPRLVYLVPLRVSAYRIIYNMLIPLSCTLLSSHPRLSFSVLLFLYTKRAKYGCSAVWEHFLCHTACLFTPSCRPPKLFVSPSSRQCCRRLGQNRRIPSRIPQSSQPVLAYVFWDHSLPVEAQNIAEEMEREELGEDVRRRLCIDFHNMLVLANENKPLAKVVAAGSLPPEMKAVWQRLEREGVKTEICDRNLIDSSERDVPDLYLQKEMLRDGLRTDPVILLTGSRAGYCQGKAFLDALETLKLVGWNVELLSWERSCNVRLRQWVYRNSFFHPSGRLL